MKEKCSELMRPYSWWKFLAPVCPPFDVILKVRETGRYVHWENIFWDGRTVSAMFYRTRLATKGEQELYEDDVITHLLPGSYKPTRNLLQKISYPVRQKERPNP